MKKKRKKKQNKRRKIFVGLTITVVRKVTGSLIVINWKINKNEMKRQKRW